MRVLIRYVVGIFSRCRRDLFEMNVVLMAKLMGPLVATAGIRWWPEIVPPPPRGEDQVFPREVAGQRPTLVMGFGSGRPPGTNTAHTDGVGIASATTVRVVSS
jgi:hypothetical protein